MANGSKESKGTSSLDRELEAISQAQPKAVQQKRAAPKAQGGKAKGARPSAKRKIAFAKGKRKEAVARARLTQGLGRILINGVDVRNIRPETLRDLILEPVKISNQAKAIAEASDIYVNIRGGGVSGQAQAARSAIAKVLSASDESLKKLYMAYDRTLLVDDSRRVEPKKFLGRKARARFQKSYR
ncbi:MAG: 30S ribosomal protein S9 [Candidatus Micrarchaeaceae archaeon]